ncbi:PhnE/PtxC family ABC transporter permease, partial [Pediococcus acidilactici]
METIDEVSGSVIEAMMASGASYLQIIWQGVLPMCLNQLLSWLLFLIENNIRDATLVGILTGTGIGFLFDF